MFRRTLVTMLLMLAAMPLAATTPSRLAPQWQTTPTMWESGTYTYDGDGNIIAVGADQYRYDGAGRLVNATANTPSYANAQAFQYDDYGNLLRIDMQVTPAGGAPVNTTTVMAVDPARNQLLEYPTASVCPTGVICVAGAYDAAGNQKSSNGYISYEWDALGNLAKLTSIGRVERYVYDANNERIMTVTATGNVERREYTLRNDDAKVLRELVDTVTSGTHQWSWTKDYVYRAGTLLASISPATAGEAIQHFHLDHLGTPRVVTDLRGYRLTLHTYLPFGVEATGSEASAERMKFTGHERDFGGGPGEDLDYMHARFYAPNTGRFLSTDPVLDTADAAENPQLWNRYLYVTDDPINGIDPDGRVALTWSRLKHIISGHILKNQQTHKSKFSSNNPKDAQKLIKKTVRQENLVKTQANGRKVYQKTFNKTVGTKGQTTVKVVTKPLNARTEQVITAYPTLNTVTSVLNVVGLAGTAFSSYTFHESFERNYGREPTFIEGFRFLVTGEERSEEAIQMDMVRELQRIY